MGAVLDQEDEMMSVSAGTVAVIAAAEIDMQVATAHKYPRSIKRFRTNVLDMVTLSEEIAGECMYAVPRDGKMIEGPSARFAEIIANAWGNSRAGARVVSDAGDFVTAQGVFHDLEANVAITYEVQRRITNKNGARFKPDMIGVTANAACSIALRNAILKGVPKAFWNEMYSAARQTAMGDVKTLPNRRAEAFKAFQNYGVSKDQVLAKLGLAGEEDIGMEQLLQLRMILTGIRDGDTTPEDAFAVDGQPADTKKEREPKTPLVLSDEKFAKDLVKWKVGFEDGTQTPDAVIEMLSSKYKLTDQQIEAIKAPAPQGDAA